MALHSSLFIAQCMLVRVVGLEKWLCAGLGTSNSFRLSSVNRRISHVLLESVGLLPWS